MADLSNSELRNILRSYGQDCGPITPQTKKVYERQVEKLQKTTRNKVSVKPSRQSEPLLNRFDPRNSPMNCYNDDGNGDDVANNCHRRSMISSPTIYTEVNHNRRHTEPYTIEPPQENGSNVGDRWYKGSLRALSSCLGTKDSGLMDISDADISDTESTLFTRLRKNYFKRTTNQECVQTQRCSPTSSSLGRGPTMVSSAISDSSHLPNIILLFFIVLIVCVFGAYLMFKTRYSHLELDIALERLLCQSSGHHHQSHCLSEQGLKSLKPYLRRLYEVTCEHAGRSACGGGSEQRDDRSMMMYKVAKEHLNHGLRRDGLVPISDDDWSSLMYTVISLPTNVINIVGYDNNGDTLDETNLAEQVTFLECLKPKISLWCRMKLTMIFFINWLFYIVVASLILGAASLVFYLLYLYRKRLREINDRRLGELKEVLYSISDILRDQLRHSECNGTMDPFLPLEKIRTMLQQTYPKLRDNQFWDQVKEYTLSHEPCILMKDTLKSGITVQWRGRPGWQGSAVHSGKEVSFERGPTECLKVRNLDVDKVHCDWEAYLRKELTSRLQDVGHVLHIGFMKKGSKVIAYIMCGSREVAGKAFNRINANYYNGNLLNVKFIRVDKYLDRFPVARDLIK